VIGLRAGAVLLAFGVLAFAFVALPSGSYGFVGTVLVWLGWLVGVTLLALTAAEAFEIVELAMQHRRDAPQQPPHSTQPPFVSLHVPICAEPPELVGRTLKALQSLRYARLEVLVIDNNTRDEALWRPVEALCRELGPRFRFFHLPRWPGYKAGALNFALAHTAPEAAVIGVIDSDYEVGADFLESLARHFADEQIAWVQAPQNYREWEDRRFSRMCHWEYWQFFAVSMRLRSVRNAILMHGTMVLIRKAALLRVGGWSEWCLTEDSELGLRLLAAGYRSVYCSDTHGRGLVPFSYRAYRRQRERWVTGGVQILKRHASLFLPWAASLTAAQKLHYLQGWAPWLRDAIIVAALPLTVALAGFSLGWARSPEPMLHLASAVLAVVTYLAARQVIVYRFHLQRPWADGVAAGIAIFGLVMTVGRAWLAGSFGRVLPFHRTPKEPQPENARGLRISAELICGATLIALGLALFLRFGREGVWAAAGLSAYAALFLSSVYVDVIERHGM
jgi:cellulose synthase/poly-beta-1,6-N-acetylglucosamine synthase-like glycosyltransferase